MKRLGLGSLVFVLLAGCSTAAQLEEDTDSSGQADTGGIAEGTAEAKGVLRVASDLSLADLLSASGAGLTTKAAENIDAYRLGDDGARGTGDDEKDRDSLRELDAIPYVGPKAFRAMLDYARRLGWVAGGGGGGGGATPETYAATPNSVIADNTTIASEITVTTTGASDSVDVSLDLTHLRT